MERPNHEKIRQLGRVLFGPEWAERWHWYDDPGPVDPDTLPRGSREWHLLVAARVYRRALDLLGLAASHGRQCSEEHEEAAEREFARAAEHLRSALS